MITGASCPAGTPAPPHPDVEYRPREPGRLRSAPSGRVRVAGSVRRRRRPGRSWLCSPAPDLSAPLEERPVPPGAGSTARGFLVPPAVAATLIRLPLAGPASSLGPLVPAAAGGSGRRTRRPPALLAAVLAPLPTRLPAHRQFALERSDFVRADLRAPVRRRCRCRLGSLRGREESPGRSWGSTTRPRRAPPASPGGRGAVAGRLSSRSASRSRVRAPAIGWRSWRPSTTSRGCSTPGTCRGVSASCRGCAHRPPALAALPRSRRVQARQRPPRPPAGQPGARRSRAPAPRLRAPDRHRRAIRRRRVRDGAARDSRGRRPRRRPPHAAAGRGGQFLSVEGYDIRLTVSIGVATLPDIRRVGRTI